MIARTVGVAWANLNPNYEDAARTLGASPVRVFTSVTWPRLSGAVYSAAMLVFLYCATSYSLVMVLGSTRTRTLETEIYRQTSQFLNLGAAAILSLIQAVIVIIALVISQRWSKSGVVVDRYSRFVAAPRPISARQRLLLYALIVFIFVLIVLPIRQGCCGHCGAMVSLRSLTTLIYLFLGLLDQLILLLPRRLGIRCNRRFTLR